MRPLADEDLILYHYGESPDAEAIRTQLAASDDDRRRYEELAALLGAVDEWEAPARPPGYEADVWRRLQPRLAGAGLRRAGDRFAARRASVRRWAPAAAAAVLLLALGYVAGRVARLPEPQAVVPAVAARRLPPLSADARQRILVETLADHLDRSERLFTELSNGDAAGGAALAGSRQAARDLLAGNRLYRTAAERGGREGVAALLDDIEPLLTEIANLPAGATAGDVEFLRQRIHAQGVLFKTRVASDVLSRALRRPAGAPPSHTI